MKYILISIMSLVMICSVFAVNGQQNTQANSCSSLASDAKVDCCIEKGYSDYNFNTGNCKISDVTVSHIKEKYQYFKPNITGLENAMIRVKTQEAAQHLQQVMSKIQTQRAQKLMEMRNTQFTTDAEGNAIAEGGRPARFLNFIDAHRKYTCKINEDGTTTRTRNKFTDLFWKDLSTDPCAENEAAI